MYDVLEKIFAVILAVVLMFFFPLLDTFERMDDLSYMTVYAATVKFVDAVKNKGIITPNMYYEFEQSLEATGNSYSIEMVHRKSSAYPEKDTDSSNTYGYIELFDEYYTYDILSQMNIVDVTYNGVVHTNAISMYDYTNFDIGDYFYVAVKNQSTTPASVIKRVLYGADISTATIMVPYGGMIRNVPIAI